jgi:hypothetical protein
MDAVIVIIALVVVYCLIGFGLYKACDYLAQKIPFFDLFGPEDTPESAMLWTLIWPVRATLYFAVLAIAGIIFFSLCCLVFAYIAIRPEP